MTLDLIHEIDMANWLLGPLEPLASFSSSTPSLDIQSETVSCSLLKSQSGTLVNINLDYVARVPLRRYVFVGDRGTLTWDLYKKSLTLQTSCSCTVVCSDLDAFDVSLTYLKAHTQFCSSVFNDSEMSQSIHDGLLSAELAIALIEKSAST